MARYESKLCKGYVHSFCVVSVKFLNCETFEEGRLSIAVLYLFILNIRLVRGYNKD